MKLYNEQIKRLLPTLLILISSILLGVWAIKEAIALRNILLVIGCSISAVYCIQLHRQDIQSFIAKKKALFFSIGLLFFWLILHYAFFTEYRAEQFNELASTWFRAAMGALLALGTGIALQKNVMLYPYLLAGMLCDFIYLYLEYIKKCLLYKEFIPNYHFYNEYIFYNKVNCILIGGIIVSIAFGIIVNNNVNKLKKIILYGVIFAIGFSYIYIVDSRNGVIQITVLTTIYIIYTSDNIKKILYIFILVIYIGLSQNHNNWKNIYENVSIALNVSKHTNWQNPNIYGYPLNKFGERVDGSLYDRISWGVVGINLILLNPLGNGVQRNSFEKSLSKMSISGPKSTHSGLVDFGLSYGIPGLLFLITPLLIVAKNNNKVSKISNFLALDALVTYTISEANEKHATEILIYLTILIITLYNKSNTKNV